MQSDFQHILTSFYRREKRMPSYSEMMQLFGFKSKNAVYRLVNKLVAASIVTKDHIGRLLPGRMFNEIPMAGLVKAGLPSSVDELQDTLNLEQYLMPKKELTYLLEVDGNSMIEAHIADGDMVLVERTQSAKDGDIVIANVDGEFTMKYLKKSGTKVWLEPANKDFKPIYPENDMTIVGIVKAVIRKY